MPSPTATRRQVAAGVAWSVPVIAAAAAVPAVAASFPCEPSLDFWGSFAFDWGNVTIGDTQTLQVSAGGRVINLPKDVTVQRVEVTHWVQVRPDRQPGPGLPWIGASNSSTRRDWSYKAQNPGWTGDFTNTTRGTSYTDANGREYTAWDITLTWVAGPDAGAYSSPNQDGCRNFQTKPSGNRGWQGPMVTTWSKNPRASSARDSRLGAYVERVVRVSLSNGTVLERKAPSRITYASNG